MTIPFDCVELRPSPIHNLGVFSKTYIQKGTIVCHYKGTLCRRDDHDHTSSYLVHVTNELLLDGKGVESVGKYINCPKGTGKKANVAFGTYNASSKCIPVITKRAIKPDEELLISYGRGYWK
jgi:hypothetical protein